MPFESLVVVAAVLVLFGAVAVSIAYAQWPHYGSGPADLRQQEAKPETAQPHRDELKKAA